jgi:hypothetical protein
MNRKTTVWILAGILLVALTGQTAGAATYASPKTQETIAKMVEAHGGLAGWNSAPTVSFDSHLKVNFGGDNWVDYWESVTVDQRTRRVYCELKNADGTSGRIAYDGETAWSAGNLQGVARAPARFTAWRNYYLFNIPWLTQDAGVVLGEVTTGTLPNDNKEYVVVPMTFEPGTGDTPRDTYTLYIDPDTFGLKAAEYGMTYKSMLPEGTESMPRSVFVWDERETVNGLGVLSKYTVYWQDGTTAVTGEVSNWAFDKPFDPSRLSMPADGTVDQTKPQ